MDYVTQSEKVEVEIKNRPFIPIFVNGQGPYRFLLDTGNQSSYISLKLAQTLRLKRLKESPNEEAFISIVEFNIGELKWKHLVCANDLSSLSDSLGKKVDGMLGYFFLKELKVTINYPKKTLVAEPCQTLSVKRNFTSQKLLELHLQELTELIKERKLLEHQEGTKYLFEGEKQIQQSNPHEVPLQIKSSLPIIPVFINRKGPFQFVLDTGSSVCVVSSELAKKLELKRGEMRIGQGGSDEEIECYDTYVETLTVGEAQCREPKVIIATDLPRLSERIKIQIDGLVGHSFLKNFTVTINYPQQTLAVQ